MNTTKQLHEYYMANEFGNNVPLGMFYSFDEASEYAKEIGWCYNSHIGEWNNPKLGEWRCMLEIYEGEGKMPLI